MLQNGIVSTLSTAIADLAAREDKPLDGFGIFGVVKEVGVDDEGNDLQNNILGVYYYSSFITFFGLLTTFACISGLIDFHNCCFSYPLYRDEQ